MATISRVHIGTFMATGQWTNRQLREAELRMIQAMDQIAQGSDGYLEDEYYDRSTSEVKSQLSAVRNSIPDNQSLPTATATRLHNDAAIEWVSLVNVAADNGFTSGKPFLEKLGNAIIETPSAIIKGVGTAAGDAAGEVGNGISKIIGNFLKNLSWVVWVLLAIVIVAAAFYFIPGLGSVLKKAVA